MIMELFSIKGKVALVTGGTRGIGLACAHALGEGGATVIVVGRSAEQGAVAVRELTAKGIKSMFFPADVSSPEGVQALMENIVAEFGAIDILVNNAGIARHGNSIDFSAQDWRDVIDVNLSGVFWCAREAARHMLASGKGGSIVNIGSMSGLASNIPQHQVAYNASKAGVHMLTKSMASEYAQSGIRVNAVAPGYISTEMTKEALNNEAWSTVWLGMTPMGRVGRPEEVSAAVLFLASGAASYITGAVLTIDGGYTTR
jgi:NAD(P)-dependent dehydrogenase (short-subunit alcohol dehydrogenase family)